MKSLQLARPHVLILVGQPGSGKTTFGRQFADMFRAPFIDTKAYSPYTSDTKSLSQLGESIIKELVKTNQTIIYEVASGSRAERLAITKLAHEHDYTPLVVWVQVNNNTASQRAKKLLKNADQTYADAHQSYKLTEPNEREPYIVISGMHTYPSQAKAILKKLSELSGRQDTPTKQPKRPASSNRRNVRVL